MNGDDDIAASLPRPPFPAPARRAAAMDEALRRFDGGEARPIGDRRPARPARWWSGPARPYAGALAGALLVAAIGLPFVWTAFDDHAGVGAGKRRAGVEAAGPAKTDAAPVQAGLEAPKPAATAADGVEPREPSAATDEVERPVPANLARTDPSPLPAAPAEVAMASRAQEPAGIGGDQASGEIVVTGSRIRRPNLESAVPVTSIGGEEAFQRDRPASKAARRGDWNACTIEDPGQSLERCRSSVDTLARGARGRAAAPLADGLAKAWTGDLEGAMAAFDRAIARSPRSSSAYLNRGLAWRRSGDLGRALADLDKAVRYAPGDARAYYYRGLVLRQRGDLRRARADEARAVELDPRYAPLVRRR